MNGSSLSFALVCWGILLSALSGVPALFLGRLGPAARAAQISGTVVLVIACAAGLAGSVMGLLEPPSLSLVLPWPQASYPLVGLDALSAFFLILIFFVGALSSIYALGYWPAERNPRSWRSMGLFFGLLVAGMALLVVARHALSFLVGWETMALAAFFLIAAEDEKAENRRAAFLYLVATHCGTLALFGMFALWRAATGSFELSPVATMGAGATAGIVLLALFGFGVKAGMMPLHFWLPGAHAAAPSHVSAMLSGVMLKMGIYGILRMLSLLPALPEAWGALILALGAISGILGVAYALAQHDLKRLLAYHSVENIGIILMGLGLALLGRAWGRPEVFALGLAGCLLHVWNHGLFKSLLFMGAGSVLRATGTRQIDLLGGLSKAMPWTTALFALGAAAICGLPPLNGFVSEFLVYMGLFGGLSSGTRGAALAALAAPCLAMIGALALACFVKALGATFLGSPRSDRALRAAGREAPVAMLVPMAALALACAAIGLAPALFAPVLDAAVGCWAAGQGSVATPRVAGIVRLDYLGAASIALAALVAIVWLLLGRARRRAASGPTWDCGYAAPTGRMQYTASSFARGLVGMFAWILRPSAEPPKLQGAYPPPEELETEVEDGVLRGAVGPASRLIGALSRWTRRFQQGYTQQYVLYILVALLVLSLTLVPFDGLLALIGGK